MEHICRFAETSDGVDTEGIDKDDDLKFVMSYGTVDTELVESWVEISEEKLNEEN